MLLNVPQNSSITSRQAGQNASHSIWDERIDMNASQTLQCHRVVPGCGNVREMFSISRLSIMGSLSNRAEPTRGHMPQELSLLTAREERMPLLSQRNNIASSRGSFVPQLCKKCQLICDARLCKFYSCVHNLWLAFALGKVTA